ncbi:hypothetical protein SUGI_0115670 [Cryptomeria japonica]|nr:hypothetical protein SUGI_0115670 [Cryptomeria japonica]
MSRFDLLYTFIFYTLLLSGALCANPNYTSCSYNQTCGGIGILYPFGLRGSGCGLPSFQIDCVDERRVIEIGSHKYTVVDVFLDNHTSTIVDEKYFQLCTSSYDSFDGINDSSAFYNITEQSFSLKILKCGSGTLCLLDGVLSPSLSCTSEEVTVKGAIAHWNITNNPLYKNCRSCESSGGWCGYNVSDEGKFLCFCEDATHPNRCPVPQGKKSSNLGPVIGGVSGGLALLLIGGFLICKIRKRRRRNLSHSPTLIAKEVEYSESRDIEAGVQQKIGNLPIFSYEILKQATSDFAEEKMLGDGGFGSVFMPPDVTHVSTAPQGTPGYLDPEYYECFQLTEKSDVYSFGVVLVELFSSKLAVDINRTRKEISLANMALAKIREGALQELVDSSLGFNLDNEVRSSITAVAELAFRCLQASKDDRPDMDEIVAQLDQIDQNWMHVKSSASHSSFGSDGGKKAFSGVPPPSPTSVQDKWPSTETTPNNSA